MFPTTIHSNNSKIFDLHGKSLKEAKLYVNKIINEASTQKTPFIRIITGKGNHPNKDGSRGLIYKRLPTWLNELQLQSLINSVEQKDGSYLINI